MESLLNFLSEHDELRFVLVFGSLTFAVILENLIPLIKFGDNRIKHLGLNLVFVVTTGIVTGLLSFIAYEVVAIHTFSGGVFDLLGLTLLGKVICGLILLDFFGQYFIHVCLHKFKWLWKLHLVHHSDTSVDASTGTRHHPGDMIVRELLILSVIAVFGIPLAVYVLYRIVTPFFSYFTHANIRLPLKVDRFLSLFIVTPNMHKFHHHFERPCCRPFSERVHDCRMVTRNSLWVVNYQG